MINDRRYLEIERQQGGTTHEIIKEVKGHTKSSRKYEVSDEKKKKRNFRRLYVEKCYECGSRAAAMEQRATHG